MQRGAWRSRSSPDTHERHSAGAARKLCNVLFKPQCRELQSLDCCEIREYRIGKIINGEALPDRECCGLDAIATLRCENVRAKKLAALCVGNELDETARVARRKSARYGAQPQD